MINLASKNIIEIDMGKALGAIAVVLIHVSAFAMANIKAFNSTYKVALILNQLARFSVPIFVLLSGVGLGLSYKGKMGYFKFCKKRLGKLIPDYLFWGLIYLLIINKNYNYNLWPNLFIKGDKIFYHLYFLPMIIKLYLIFPVLYMGMKKVWGLTIAFLISVGITITAHYFNMPNLTLDFYSKRNIVFWFFYFVVGVFLSSKIQSYISVSKKHKKLLVGILLLCVFGIIWESVYNLKIGKNLDYCTTFIRPSIVIYSIAFVFFTFSLSYNNKIIFKLLKKITNNSYVVYLSHPFILHYYMEWFKIQNFKIGSIYFIITAVLVCTIIPVIFGEMNKLINNILFKKRVE